MSIVPYQRVENNVGLPPLFWGELWIIADVIQLFFTTFSFSDLLAFEGAGRHYHLYTQRRWKQLRVEERFDFDWSGSKTEKSKYIQCKALFSYCNQPQSCFSAKNIQVLYDRFEGIMLAYPHSLGAYIWEDIKDEGVVASLYADLFHSPSPIPDMAGDLLIEGLCSLKREPNLYYIDEVFSRAITKGATCASLLALGYLIDPTSRKRWVLLSALHKDYRGLEKLLFELSPERAKKYYEEGVQFPPVFAGYARELALEGKHGKADKLWDRALTTYEDQVPTAITLDAARTKSQLKKNQEAESLYEYYIKAQEKRGGVAPQVWEEMGATKYLLGKYGEAEILFKKSIQAYEEVPLPVPPDLWNKLAHTKSWLEKFEEAEVYFEKCIMAYEEESLPISPNLWANRAATNVTLKRYKVAEGFFEKAIIGFTTQNLPIPPSILTDVAKVKYHLGTQT